MPAYVASARIVRAEPRLARSEPADETLSEATILEAAVRLVPIESNPDTRWQAFRARWSQLTFYLFDPNSWR